MSGPLRPPLEDADFGEEYYRVGVGRPYRKDQHWLGFFTPIADRIVSEIKPRRVLDAGCALGILVELLRERGVEAYGFDISSYAIAHVPEPVRPFCWRASVTDELSEDYDLILWQEVFPHVAPSSAEAAIANFCRHTCDVLFSSPPFIARDQTRRGLSERGECVKKRSGDEGNGAAVDQSPKTSLRTVREHRDTRDIDRCLAGRGHEHTDGGQQGAAHLEISEPRAIRPVVERG